MDKLVNLTKHYKVTNGAHILYFFENQTDYINNLVAYIKAGVDCQDHVMIIDDPIVLEKLETKLIPIERELIHFIDHQDFYQIKGNFDTESILKCFGEKLIPLYKQHKVRTWANVIWEEENQLIYDKIDHFEQNIDYYIEHSGIMTVCAYYAPKISAKFQTKLMRSHEYFMTDQELVRSSFYKTSSED